MKDEEYTIEELRNVYKNIMYKFYVQEQYFTIGLYDDMSRKTFEHFINDKNYKVSVKNKRALTNFINKCPLRQFVPKSYSLEDKYGKRFSYRANRG